MAAIYCTECGVPLDARGVCSRGCHAEATAPAVSEAAFPAASALAPPAPYAWEDPRGATPPPTYAALPPPSVSATPPFAAAPLTRFSGKWNWGAFLLCPLWLMNHGALWLGIAYLVIGFIPFLGIAALGMAVYFGITGNDWAVRHRAFVDEAQFVAVQNAWRNWGFSVLAVGLTFGAIGAISIGLLGVLSGVHSH